MLTWESDSFAYAERYDPVCSRYQGTIFGQARTVALDEHGVLVKPDAARRQVEADDIARLAREETERQRREQELLAVSEARERYVDRSGSSASDPPPPHPVSIEPSHDGMRKLPNVRRLRRYHGAARLDTLKVGRDATKIAEEILMHLAGLPGAQVSVTIEIEARLPEGAPDHVVRTVTENSRVLKFQSFGFEED